MKKTIIIVKWIVELTILAGLLWGIFNLYDLTIAFYLLLISPVLAFIHWRSLKREHIENKISQSVRFKLFYLTGPAIFLSMSLVLCIQIELVKIARGTVSKEIQWSYLNKEREPKELGQWTIDSIEKMKSDRVIYAMLLASMLLLYDCRCSPTKSINALRQSPEQSKGANTCSS